MNFYCSNITKPEDISSQCDYKDEFPKGRNDRKLVACCQSKDDGNNYDELKNFYEEHFSEEERNKYGEKILKAMCKCCNKKGKGKWSWDMYKKCVKDELQTMKLE